jgi:hypothetical protein
MLADAGSSKALDVHGFSGETLHFDSIDRCFAALAATGFVGFIAVVASVWLG